MYHASRTSERLTVYNPVSNQPISLFISHLMIFKLNLSECISLIMNHASRTSEHYQSTIQSKSVSQFIRAVVKEHRVLFLYS